MENLKLIEKYNFKKDAYGTDCTAAIDLLNNYIDKLNFIYLEHQKDFAEFCYYIKQIKNLFDNRLQEKVYYGRLVTTDNNYIFFDNIMQNLGLSQSTVSKILSVYEKFVIMENGIIRIMGIFSDFSKSKLFELLQVPNDYLIKDINTGMLKSSMSVQKIREYVKNYKTMIKQKQKLSQPEEEKQEKQQEEIPDAYNPKQYYEFSYFEKKNKSQLLNIVWDLQKEYQKLKERRK